MPYKALKGFIRTLGNPIGNPGILASLGSFKGNIGISERVIFKAFSNTFTVFPLLFHCFPFIFPFPRDPIGFIGSIRLHKAP